MNQPPPWMKPEDGDEGGEEARVDPDASAPGGEREPEAAGPGADPEVAAGEQVLEELGNEDETSALRSELAETKNRMLRIAADFDNFRKRSRKELDDARVKGREEVLREVLPVLDNLERALQAVGTPDEGGPAAAIIEGVQMVQKQFDDGLARFGVKRFTSVGEPFDPNFHEAMAQVDSADHAPGTVVIEYQKGYMLGERLLRPAMVVVARARPEGGGAASPAAGEPGADGAEPDGSDGQSNGTSE